MAAADARSAQDTWHKRDEHERRERRHDAEHDWDDNELVLGADMVTSLHASNTAAQDMSVHHTHRSVQ